MAIRMTLNIKQNPATNTRIMESAINARFGLLPQNLTPKLILQLFHLS